MSIWHKVLIGLIAVASIGFFYMAARTYKIRKHWGDKAIAFEKRLKEVRRENEILKFGSKDDPKVLGVEQLQDELHKALLHRGRVWRNCTGRVTNPANGQVSVTTDKPEPHGIPDKKILFVFEEKSPDEFDKNERYLGEFKVTGVDEAKKLVALEPTMKFSDRELNRLKESKTPWVLYEVMPRDSHDTFAGLKEEELKAILPESSVAEYIRDGQPAEANDPAENKQTRDGKDIFVRTLRDYQVVFSGFLRDRSIWYDMMQSGERDETRLASAIENVKQQEEHCKKTIADLRAELATMRQEQDAANAHRKAVEQKLGEVQQLVAERIRMNLATAQEIARIQREAADRINRRTGAAPAASVN